MALRPKQLKNNIFRDFREHVFSSAENDRLRWDWRDLVPPNIRPHLVSLKATHLGVSENWDLATISWSFLIEKKMVNIDSPLGLGIMWLKQS
jgi:hypothetical protein